MSTFKYAVRTLVKTPGFSVIAIATMRWASRRIPRSSASSTGVLLKPLPFRDERRAS